MVRKISVELEEEILKQYYTHTAKELGEKYKIKPNTIKGIWQRNGYTGKKLFSPDVEEFTKLYNSLSIEEIASFYKKNRHTITNFAKRIGIYQKKEKILTPEEEQEILNSYYTTTSTELAKKYNVSTSKISQLWTQAGLRGKTNRTYYLDENYFENIDTDDKAYWVGFIAADGCLYHPKDGRQDILSISLAIQDKEHLEKLQKNLKTNKPLSISSHGRNKEFKHASLQISSNKISKDLQKIGVTPRKTYSVQWPKIEEKFLPAYIRGYFDGDGYISHKIERDNLHSVHVDIVGFLENMKNFQAYLLSKGIKTSISLDKRKYKIQNFCSLRLNNKKEKQKFLHLIYDNASVYLDRKYILAQNFIDLCKENPRTWEIHKKIRRTE